MKKEGGRMKKVVKKESSIKKFIAGFFKFFLRVIIFFAIIAGIVYGVVYLEIFSISDQTLGGLIVSLDSSQQSFTVDSGESANVTFFMRALPKGECVAECSLSLVDTSNNVEIYEEVVNIENPLQRYAKSFELVAPKYGEGQIIYNFHAICHNIYSDSCNDNETIVKKTEIITLNYKLSETYQQLKPEIKQRLQNLLEEYSEIEVRYQNLKIGLDSLRLNHEEIDSEFTSYQTKVNSLIDLWNQQKYDELNANIDINFSQLSEDINLSSKPIREFNEIVDLTNSTMPEIPIVAGVSEAFNLSSQDILKGFNPIIESIISKNFNLTRNYNLQFQQYYPAIKEEVSSILNNIIIENSVNETLNMTLPEKFDLAIKSCVLNQTNVSENVTDCDILLDISITPLENASLNKIPESFDIQPVKFDLSDNPPICCVFGRCSTCCINQSCSFTPLMLVHGHLFNEKNSPDYSVIEFELLQNELEKNGYINAGTITPESSMYEFSKGDWGLSGNPLSVSATYYDENGKNLSISDYASNLNYEINLIKYRTNQEKVDIIAYSMGGLVVREYLRSYGEDSVNKIIFIATPQNGTSGKVNALCPIFGSNIECEEMQKGSKFLNDLNSYQPKKVRLFNFVGSGCLMENKQDGDGIVTVENAVLRNDFNAVKTFKINGNCPSSSNLLHASIINVEKHPEVFENILEILRTN